MNRVILIKDNKKEEFLINQEELSSFLLKNEEYFIIYESLIKNEVNGTYSEDQVSLNINIPKSIDYSSVITIYKILQELEQDSKYILKKIYNIREDDFDTYELSNRILNQRVQLLYNNENNFMNNSNIQKLKNEGKSIVEEVKKELNISEIFLLFVKEKQGLLSLSQQDLFKHYRCFDIRNILTVDENLNYSLNNGNAGSITIFEDEVKKTTTTKKYHDNEFEMHLRTKGYKTDVFKYKNNFNDFIKFVTDYHCCFIRLFTSGLMIWAPEELNDYQINEIENILKEVNIIEKESNQKFDIYSYGILKIRNQEEISIDDLIEKLLEIKNNNKKIS